MSDSAMIELEAVEKTFRLYPDLVTSRIKQYTLFWNKYYREKRALDDINLRIDRGEVVGVIGPNGAGKTTLLKIIAGISRPTGGVVRTRGSVVAVLALGLGFHPRLTGLQNLELAGMMLGMSRAEIRARKDWIIEFSELGDYINYPLTSYSTGMRARLSFSVAACQEPDILIIDEALATGDIHFVQKCIDRIQEITKSGTTALFVSHNIWSIKRLTRRCILIDGGKVVDDGDTGPVSDQYYESMLKQEILVRRGSGLTDLADYVGTGEVVLKNATLLNADAKPTDTVNVGGAAQFVFDFEGEGDRDDISVAAYITRNDGVQVTVLGSLAGGVVDQSGKFYDSSFSLRAGKGNIRFVLDPVLLAPGDYSIDMHIFNAKEHSGYTSPTQFYFKPRVLEFGVRRLGNPNRSIVFYQPADMIDGGREN